MTETEHNEIRDKIGKELDIIFPYLDQRGSMSIGSYFSPDHLSNKNSSWQGTQYYYSDKAELVHFTSLKALFSILQEKSIRMYCFNNSNDPTEYYFAKNLLKISDKVYNGIKENYFTLSASLPKEVNNANLWTKYSSEGMGVAIKFCFENYDNWQNYYLAKVDYDGNHPFQNLVNLQEEIINAKEAYVNLFDFLGDFLCFHKSTDWRDENEYRLVYNGRNHKEYEHGESPTVFPDIKKDFSIIKYHSLPLKVETIKHDKGRPELIFENENELRYRPQIKIQSVILGEKIPAENKMEIAYKIKSFSRIKLGYKIEIEF